MGGVVEQAGVTHAAAIAASYLVPPTGLFAMHHGPHRIESG